MSTILEALEARDGVTAPPERQAPSRWWLVGVFAALAALAAAVTIWPSPPTVTVEPPAAALEEPAAPVPPAPPRPAADAGEPPRARLERWSGAPPRPRAVPPPGGPPPAEESAVDAAAAGLALHLQAIRYAEDAGRSTVTLSVDGGPPVNLRQGDALGGVEVQLILPRAVYLRYGGDIFALGDLD